MFNLLPEAFLDADSAFVIDNSNEPELILKKEADILYTSKNYPQIIITPVKKIINAFADKSLVKEI